MDWVGLVVFNARGGAREEPAQPPEGYGRDRLGTLCTCFLWMPVSLSSRMKSKIPLDAEAK
jgi:hypothetical protein